jgi:hypothetical protein
MASLCLLHRDPLGGRGGVAAFAAPQADVADFAGSRRAKIWELSANLHCSIVGTCLMAGELRQFFVRLGDSDARDASDHALHGRGVRLASRREEGGKLLNKALDKRHEGAIRRFAKAEDPAQLRALWTQSLDQGEIAGPYWALLTHPAADAKLAQDVFGDVHMLSHQVGAAARLDIARLRRLDADVSERDDKIARQQARLAAAAAEKVDLRETIEKLQAQLQAQLAVLRAAPAARALPGADAFLLPTLRSELALERARTNSLFERLQASEASRIAGEEETRDAVDRATRAERERADLEAAIRPRAMSNDAQVFGEALRGAKVLYVGGRPKLIDQLKTFVAERGGALIAHDGGVDDSLALLPGLVSQADAVYFPVDCISHSAAEKVKTVCRRLAKRWTPLRSASVASFLSEIAAGNDLREARFRAAAE